MRLTENGSVLHIATRARFVWLLGAAFILGGVAPILFSIDELLRRRATVTWETWGNIALGVFLCVTGLGFLRAAPAVDTTLDRATGRGLYASRTFGRPSTSVEFLLVDIREAFVSVREDSEGDASYGVSLRLADGSTLAISGENAMSERSATEGAARIAGFVGVATAGPIPC